MRRVRALFFLSCPGLCRHHATPLSAKIASCTADLVQHGVGFRFATLPCTKWPLRQRCAALMYVQGQTDRWIGKVGFKYFAICFCTCAMATGLRNGASFIAARPEYTSWGSLADWRTGSWQVQDAACQTRVALRDIVLIPPILSGLRAVAAGSCRSMRTINKRRPSLNKQTKYNNHNNNNHNNNNTSNTNNSMNTTNATNNHNNTMFTMYRAAQLSASSSAGATPTSS